MPPYFINTGFFAGLPRTDSAGELGVHPTVAFYLTNFYVGDVCELVCHRNLHAPFQFHKFNSVVLKLKEMLKVAFCV